MATMDVEQGTALPPGSRLPALVQSVLFLGMRKRFQLDQRRRYGDVFTTRLAGPRTVVTISRPDHIREVFAGAPEIFHAGEGNAILAAVMGPNSVLITDEDVHRRARKLLMPAFNGAALRGYGDLMTELATADARRWPTGRAFPVHPRMNAVTLEIILRVVFGMVDGDRLTALRPAIRRITDIGPLALLGWTYPTLERFWPWRRNRERLATADALLYAEITDRRAVGDLGDRDDVLSRLLSASGGEMSDAELRDQMMTLLLAGHETTATALAWSFHELARRPDVQAKARQAADDGDDDYLTAVAKEAMRRRPVIQNIGRMLTEPTEVAGWRLPARTVVAPSILIVQQDAEHYDDPKDFRPERFIGKSPEAGTWIPFGGGVRRCLGAGFALQEVAAVLRAVLTRYELRAPRPAPEPSKPRNITLIPGRGARIIAVPRS